MTQHPSLLHSMWPTWCYVPGWIWTLEVSAEGAGAGPGGILGWAVLCPLQTLQLQHQLLMTQVLYFRLLFQLSDFRLRMMGGMWLNNDDWVIKYWQHLCYGITFQRLPTQMRTAQGPNHHSKLNHLPPKQDTRCWKWFWLPQQIAQITKYKKYVNISTLCTNRSAMPKKLIIFSSTFAMSWSFAD